MNYETVFLYKNNIFVGIYASDNNKYIDRARISVDAICEL